MLIPSGTGMSLAAPFQRRTAPPPAPTPPPFPFHDRDAPGVLRTSHLAWSGGAATCLAGR